MISEREAADIALEHGLGLSDARALHVLASDVEDAHRLAAQFAPADDMREMVAKVPRDPTKA